MASESKYGQEGTNTNPSPGSGRSLKMITQKDGFSMIAPDDMYRIEETHIGRRECSFPGLHNLHESVIARTINPPPIENHRAVVWDTAAQATREALADIPAGSHVNICANSGPGILEFEKLPPWHKVRGAIAGLLYVAEFRDKGSIHWAWKQVAAPIRCKEGRLLAGLRLLPAVTGRADLTFHVTNLTNHNVSDEWFNAIRDHPSLTYGCVVNSYRPTNLGCTFFRGLHFESDAHILRASFAWDGQLYGWDEAVLYTRKPVVLLTNVKPERRFQHWQEATILFGVTWYRLVNGMLVGGYQAETTRAQLVEWDAKGIPSTG